MSSWAQRATRGRFFYGWLVVGVAGYGTFWGSGISSDTLAVLLKPFTEELGVTRTSAVLGVTLAAIVGGIASPLLGPVVDRIGARLPLAVSAVIAGGTLLLLSHVQELWQFMLLFGIVLGACRPGIQQIAPAVAVSNWFVRRRGRAVAIMSIGQPLSKVVLVPMVQLIVSAAHWRAAWSVMGATMWATLVIPALLVIRRRPEDMGLLPDGDTEVRTAGEPAAGGAQGDARAAVTEINWDTKAAMKTSAFWLITFGFTFISLAVSGLFLHMFAYFTDQGVPDGQAAGAIAVFGTSIVTSRLAIWIIVLDRLPIRRSLIVWGVVITGAIGTMLLVQNTVTAYFAAISFGVGMGGNAPLSRLVWPEYYGRRSVGAITGVVQIFQAPTSAMGPLVASLAYDLTGSYQIALWLFTAGSVLGLLMLVLAQKPRHPSEQLAAVAG